MKIAILCYSHSWGGLEMNIFKLAQWLKERGNEIILIAEKNSKLSKKAVEAGIPTEYLWLTKSKIFHFLSISRLNNILKKHQTQHLMIGHYRQYYLSVWAKSFAFDFSIKLIYLQQMRMNLKRTDVYHAYYFNRIDAWLTPLLYLKQELFHNTTLKESQIYLHPLSCDTSLFCRDYPTKEDARKLLDLQQNQFVVGIAGRLDKEKGQEYLLDAIKILKDRNLDIKALIVGEETAGGTGYLNKLRRKTADFGLEEYIIFRPFVENIEIFYKAIDVFSMCSINEPFGMVTVEALLSGTPVVGAKAGGTTEILEQGKWGNLFELGRENALADAIQGMYLNYALATEKSKSAKSMACDTYSHTSWCEAIEQILQKI